MKILNLIYPEKSDIKYKISKFPDGQQNIVIENNPLTWCLPSTDKGATYKHDNIQIKSRLNNWLDLELITCTVASLRELGVDEIHLYVPYVVGARSDRKFEEGGNNYLKDVITPVINSLEFSSVTVLDPHSDCLEMGIKGFKKESNYKLVKDALSYIDSSMEKELIFISPDAGASKKIYKLEEQFKLQDNRKIEVITCSKDRDNEGKLTKTVVPSFYKGKDVIIIDDICDGGATFINIAKIIKERNEKYPDEKHPVGKLYLIITHGIFSKGFEELSLYFDDIYCTNSYKDIQSMGTSRHMKFVKQLNIF